MPLRPTLLAEIQSTLGAAMTPSLTPASAGSDIFEGYVLSIVLGAAAAEGAAITYENVDGTSSTTFTFRTSPGQIWWRTRPFTHAIVRFPNMPTLEVHTGVYVTGSSGVSHEADVLILLSDEAQTCRNNQATPRSSKIVAASECKFYSNTPGLHLGRGFLGLCLEFSSRDCVFVTNSAAPSIEKLLASKKKRWEHRVVPSNANEVNRLRVGYQEIFKSFKSKN